MYELSIDFGTETEARILRRLFEDADLVPIAQRHFALGIVRHIAEQLPTDPPTLKEKPDV